MGGQRHVCKVSPGDPKSFKDKLYSHNPSGIQGQQAWVCAQKVPGRGNWQPMRSCRPPLYKELTTLKRSALALINAPQISELVCVLQKSPQ